MIVQTEDKKHTNFKVLKSYTEFNHLEKMVKDYAQRQALYYQDALVLSPMASKNLNDDIGYIPSLEDPDI